MASDVQQSLRPAGRSFEVAACKSSPSIDWEGMRKMTVFQAVMETVAFMAVPFLMPSIFARTGWWWGLGFMTFSTLLTFYNGTVLGDICAANPDLHTYPEIAEEAFRRCADKVECMKEAQVQWARRGRICVQLLQLGAYFLSGIAELIYVQQYLAELLPWVPICQRTWLVVVALCLWPFFMIPTFQESQLMATITVGVIFFNFAIFLYQVSIVQPWTCEPPPAPAPLSPIGILSGITGIIYAFGGHGLYPELLREMEQPQRWRSVMWWTYGIVVPMYFVVGVLGYYSYGGNARANLNLNYPRNTANVLSLVAQTIEESYCVIVPALVILLQAELALRVDPTAWCSYPEKPSTPAPARAPDAAPQAVDLDAAASGVPLAGLTQSATSWAAPGGGRLSRMSRVTAANAIEDDNEGQSSSWRNRLSLRVCGVPPAGFRFIFRSLFLGIQATIAVLLLGGDGDILLSIQSLAGAVGFTALTYFLPLVFGWVMLPPPSRVGWWLQIGCFTLCVLLMIVGIYFEVQAIAEVAGGFTSEVECTITAENFTGSGCEAAVDLGDDDY